MATPDTRNSDVAGATTSTKARGQQPGNNTRSSLSRRDWFAYAMAIAIAFTTIAAILVIWGADINSLAMISTGAVLFTVATAIWVSYALFLTLQILRILLAPIWRRFGARFLFNR